MRTTPRALACAAAGVLIGAGIPTAALGAPAPAADLRADVNRDGRIDIKGDTDTNGEDRATVQYGALFLPNVDDDARRCKAQDIGCRDGADNVVNGWQDSLDLARLKTVPMPSVSAGAVGRLEVLAPGAGHTRVFVKRGLGWQLLRHTDRLTTDELKRGVEFGLEGTDIIRDARRWDGRVTVRLVTTANGRTTADDVVLRSAPLLTHHHRQRAQQLLVANLSASDWAPPAYKRESARFVAGLKREAAAAGIKAPVVELTEYGDIWVQDFFEPMYASMPGIGGRAHGMRVLFRSHQPWRDSGLELYRRLRGPGVGVVELAAGGHDGSTLDSMGNMETIPPYRHNGKSYPAGRIIMGEWKQHGMAPSRAVRDFLSAQGMQSPLILDTSWLYVGHVDEFIQFLPADTPRGWRIAVADPDAGLKLLQDAQAAGHGGTRMFSRPDSPDMPAPRATIAQTLADRTLLADNALAARKIRENLELIKRETGIGDTEIIRVPGLFKGESETGDLAPKLRRFSQREIVERPGAARLAPPPAVQMSAYVPGAVNGVVLSPTRYLAAKQWGPVIGGRDLFGDAVTAAYAGAGLQVAYLDDWMYHIGAGEVHCGTNTLRDTSGRWWRP